MTDQNNATASVGKTAWLAYQMLFHRPREQLHGDGLVALAVCKEPRVSLRSAAQQLDGSVARLQPVAGNSVPSYSRWQVRFAR